MLFGKEIKSISFGLKKMFLDGSNLSEILPISAESNLVSTSKTKNVKKNKKSKRSPKLKRKIARTKSSKKDNQEDQEMK